MKIFSRCLYASLLGCLCSLPAVAENYIAPAEAATRDACLDDDLPDNAWLDRSQAYVSKSVCGVAIWFDRFFTDERDEAENVNRYVRMINSVYWDKLDGFDGTVRLNARIEFPKFKKKINILLQSESDNDATDVLSQGTDTNVGQPIKPLSVDPTQRTTVDVRWNVLQQRDSSFSLSAGLRVNPISPRLRGRYRYTHSLSERALARFTQNLYWEYREGYGESSRLDLERLLNKRTLLRGSVTGGTTEVSAGFEWSSDVSLFHHLDASRALAWVTWVKGASDPKYDKGSGIQEYGTSVRLRQNFYRPWLYFELEPYFARRLQDDNQFANAPGIILRLEIQFGHKIDTDDNL